MNRLAIVFSDGSVSILTDNTSVEAAHHQRKDCDRGETNPKRLSKVAEVQFQVVKIISNPTEEPHRTKFCEHCGGSLT